jgi:hypothetical protein
MTRRELNDHDWHNPSRNMEPLSWTCGYCGHFVATKMGYLHSGAKALIYICPRCGWPSTVQDAVVYPAAKPGRSIQDLPKEIEAFYEEARDCMTTNSYAAVVMLCRALLLRIAKDKGIPDTKKGFSPTFEACIDYLADEEWIAKKDKKWVKQIRAFGTVANHQLSEIKPEDASKALEFVQHVLTSMYEYQGDDEEFESEPQGD